MSIVFQLFLLVLTVFSPISSEEAWLRPVKTTTHLKEIVIGRCHDYYVRNEVQSTQRRDCNKIWTLFFASFGFKMPCGLTPKDYSALIDYIQEPIEQNRGLLWSGTKDLAHRLSGRTRRLISLEDTLLGYLFDELKWCGDVSAPGVNNGECPWECAIQKAYWTAANQKFAENLQGEIHILVNGSRLREDNKIYPAYMKDRYYLGPVVIPSLDKVRISSVIVMVAYSADKPRLETCSKGSIKDMIQDILKLGIGVKCEEDPEVITSIIQFDGGYDK